MPFCRKCGAALSDDAAFCESCGTAVAPSGAPVSCPPNAEQGMSAVGLGNQDQSAILSQPKVPERKKSRTRIIAIVCTLLVVVVAVAIAVAISLLSGQPAPGEGNGNSSASSNLAADSPSQEGASNDVDDESKRGESKSDVGQVAGEWEALAVITGDTDGFVPVAKDSAEAIIDESGQVTFTLGSDTREGVLKATTQSTDDGDPFLKLVLEDGSTFTVLYTADEELLTFAVDSRGSSDLNAITMQRRK